MIVKCSYCGKENDISTSKVNRAKKAGLNLYCNKKCAGLARRSNKTEAQKKQEKRIYDQEYRKKNIESIKQKKKEYFKRHYAENPEHYRKQRKKRYPKHLEYLITPEYKEYKKQYDRKYHAKKNYGEYWESQILIEDIKAEYENRVVKQSNNLINKSQKRKRLWQKNN